MAKAFRGKVPWSIDKSAWDWTVNSWHVAVIRLLIPRMILRINTEWETIFSNRMRSLFDAGYPVFKFPCKCEFRQLVTGIMKSGCLGTIGFNSIWQVAGHIASGGDPEDVFFSLGDDTAQEDPLVPDYLEKLRCTGAVVKEVDTGYPIKFGGHEFNEDVSRPAYAGKHMFNLLHLEEVDAEATLDSYQYLYTMHQEGLDLIQDVVLDLFGPQKVLSKPYLMNWYNGYE